MNQWSRLSRFIGWEEELIVRPSWEEGEKKKIEREWKNDSDLCLSGFEFSLIF